MSGVLVKYSKAFKLKVVRELDTGKIRSIAEASHIYGI
jgi:hypothetical protein